MPIGKRVGDATKLELKGQPLSDWDIKNITYLIAFYEKAFPGVINYHAKEAFSEVEPILKQKTIKKSELNLSRRMSIPQGLWVELKRGYPAIIHEPQFSQFLRAFPIFDLHRKTWNSLKSL